MDSGRRRQQAHESRSHRVPMKRLNRDGNRAKVLQHPPRCDFERRTLG